MKLDDSDRRATRSNRQRTIFVAVVATMFLAAGSFVVLQRRSTSTVATPATETSATMSDGRTWLAVRKDVAGLGDGASINAATHTATRMVLAGADEAGSLPKARVWSSTDGQRWSAATVPSRAGRVVAVAVSPVGTALAIGIDASAGVSGPSRNITSFVWRSDDGGATFHEVNVGDRIFGEPAPAMGRPSADTLVWHSGAWLAGGAASNGLAGLWRSVDGTTWSALDVGSNHSGAMNLNIADDGALVGYGIDERWSDPNLATRGGAPQPMAVPLTAVIVDVAPDGVTAVAAEILEQGQPTPLLRSADSGASWTIDPRFLVRYPDAHALRVTTVGPILVLWGYAGDSSRAVPGAWYTVGGEEWHELPRTLITSRAAQVTTSDAIGGPVTIGAMGDRVVLASSDRRVEQIFVLSR